MTQAERAARIKEIMLIQAVTEAEAQAILAIELGEITGDIKAIKED